MGSIPILGQTPAQSQPLHIDVTEAQQAALEKMADENPPGDEEIRTPVTTAFLVVIGEDGAVVADSNISQALDLLPRRGATPDDIYGACAVVQKDLSVMETAQRTQQHMMAVGQAMQRQAQEAQIRSGLNLKI